MSVLKAMPKSDMVKKLDVIFIKMKKLMGKHIGLRCVIISYYPRLWVTPKLWVFLGCGVLWAVWASSGATEREQMS